MMQLYPRRRCNITWKTIRIHQDVFWLHKWECIDHIDWNRLDNRMCNLRSVSYQVNNINRNNLNKNNKSWHIWVYYSKRDNRWISKIETDRKQNTLSSKTIEEAIEKRKFLEETYFHPILKSWQE